MIEPGLSFGKSHNLFFLFSGIITLLVWTSIISLDQFWKSQYFKNITSYYPFLSNFGGLLGLLLYDKFNRNFTFKTQLLYFPFFLLMSFIVLISLPFLEGVPNQNTENDYKLNLKNMIFMLVILFQGGINTVLQVIGNNFFNNLIFLSLNYLIIIVRLL